MHDLNFFTEYIEKRKNTQKKAAVVYTIVVLILLSVISSYVVTEWIAVGVQAETSSMKEYLSDAKTLKQRQEIDVLKQKLDILSQYGEQLNVSLNSINSIDIIKSSLLEKFNTALPANVVMTSLNYARTSISIKGTAEARVPVAELAYNLNALGVFTEVHISNISSEAEAADSYQFEADCKLKGEINQ